jgi:hypothetical protein
VTCPTWDEAIAVLPGECLALVNTDWQVHVLRADKGTVVAERSDGGKLRVTCPLWDDAIAILPGECLALVNIKRQVHVLRAKAPLPPQHAPPPAVPRDVPASSCDG